MIYIINYFQVDHNGIRTHSSITTAALPPKTNTTEPEEMVRRNELDSITSLSFRFLTHMKNVDPWNDWASVSGNNITVVIFWDTVNMINVILCMMVVITELYPFKPLAS